MKIKRIESPRNQGIRELLKREEAGEIFVFEGEKLVRDVLSRKVPFSELILGSASRDDPGFPVREYGREAGRLWSVSDAVMRRLSGLNCPPGWMVTVPGERVGPRNGKRKSEVTLVMHGIQDPVNGGAVLRSAAAFGAGRVVFTGSSLRLNNRKMIRGAQDALFSVDCRREEDFDTCLSRGGMENGIVYVTTVDPGVPAVSPEEVCTPCVIVFGSEGEGVDAEWLRRFMPLRIPHRQGVNSLNLAVSAGIILYSISRR